MAETEGNLQGMIESILFVAGEAVAIPDLARALQIGEDALKKELNRIGSAYDDNIQLATRPLYADAVVRLLQPVQKQSLSQAAMETLAVVAYKQPVTRAEVEQIRGVKCDYSLQSLIYKGLIREVGRKDTIGRPILFGTTDEFLSHFGLRELADLPPMPEPDTEQETGEASMGRVNPQPQWSQLSTGELAPFRLTSALMKFLPLAVIRASAKSQIWTRPQVLSF